MDTIACLGCEKTLKLPQYVDTDNYDGQLRCSKCQALLYVKLTRGKVRKYKIIERSRPKEQKWNIVVQNEETKQLTQRVGDRTRKEAESGKKGVEL